jgi:ribosomal protein S20
LRVIEGAHQSFEAGKGLIGKNKAARHKSRLNKAVKALGAA